MPTIVPEPAAVVNEPPIQGPPVPVAARPVEGPPIPAGFVAPALPPVAPSPPVAIPGQPSQNSAPPPIEPPTPVDPLAISRQALGDAAQATKDQRAAAEAEALAQQQKNESDAKAADEAAAEIRKRQEDHDRQKQASDQARARLVALAEQADADVANFKFDDYGETMPFVKKLKLAIGTSLAGLNGEQSMAQINKVINRHFEQQKAELSTKEAVAKYRRQGIDDHDKHVNDQRLYLEFAERNFREAMAKEAEARGLRSGNPMALARAQQLAAKLRMDGDAKLVDMANAYIQGEERREHANLLRKKAGAARGGGSGGGMEDIMALAATGNSSAIKLKVAGLAVRRGLVKPKEAPDFVKKVYADLASEGGEGGGSEGKTAVFDSGGKFIGNVTGGKGGAQAFSTRDADYSRGMEQLEALARDIRENGGRVMLPEAVKRRKTLYHNAVIGVATVSPLGKTDSALHEEQGSLGESGAYTTTGANLDAVERKIGELREQQERYRAQGLLDYKAKGGKGGGHDAEPAPAAAKYKPGTVVKQGSEKYRFNGGDQNDAKNWTLVP